VLEVVRPYGAPPGVSGNRFVFVLTRQRTDLQDLVLALSDPTAPDYGRYWSVADVAAEYGASDETIATVVSYLGGRGIAAAPDVTRTFVGAILTTQQIESLFGPQPPFPPPVPAALADVVTVIVGAVPGTAAPVTRPAPVRAASRDAAADGAPWPRWSMGSGTPWACPAVNPLACTNDFANPGPPQDFVAFSPDQLRTAYGMAATGLTGRGRSAVVVQMNGAYVEPGDIAAYSDGLGLPPLRLRQIVVDGPRESLRTNSEAALDVEMLAGMAPGLAALTLITAPTPTVGDYAAYWLIVQSLALDQAVTGGELIDVLSSSYSLASCEPDIATPSFAPVILANEAIFLTAAAAGVTAVASAGDQGSTACVPREPPYTDTFLAVQYPGSSPSVTSVGATNLLLAPDDAIREARVWNDWPLQLAVPLEQPPCATPPCRPQPVWASGGGESIMFERPPWQPGGGAPASAWRQVPDIALMGDIYPGTLTYYQGQWSGSGNGTSQAAPTFAAMVLHLNEYATATGRPRIGFANPLLYRLAAAAPWAFVDVVEGDNVIGDNDTRFAVACCNAAVGYDRASGWGSPLLDRVIAALEAGAVPAGR